MSDNALKVVSAIFGGVPTVEIRNTPPSRSMPELLYKAVPGFRKGCTSAHVTGSPGCLAYLIAYWPIAASIMRDCSTTSVANTRFFGR